ncbi:MAG: ATP-binding protein, partial [Schwartzia sp.]|nr:ATP-binding protein [Schwartzia sp. (in: firmicutes)]
ETEARDREEVQAKRRARMAEIRQLKADGLRDASLKRCTFENDLGYQPESAKLRAYAEQFPAMRKRGAGLLLWGDVGTGKTFLAACVANYLLDRSIPVLIAGTGELLNQLMGIYPSERSDFLKSLNAYSLLILDDLGVEHRSEFAMTQMFHIVDGRCRTGKPLIVTTNLTLQELKNPPDLAHARIYDRLLEMCTPIRINGQNVRRLRAQEQMKAMKASLSAG